MMTGNTEMLRPNVICRLLAGIIGLAALVLSVSAAETNAATEMVVDLGPTQKMEFVWIESLKMWVGKYEVTNGQFKRFKSGHDSGKYHDFTLNEDRHPVVRVNCADVQAFCEWLNENYTLHLPKGTVFRLPTEKEWEAIARCGDDR